MGEETNLPVCHLQFLGPVVVDAWGTHYFVAIWNLPCKCLEPWSVVDHVDDPDPVLDAQWVPVDAALRKGVWLNYSRWVLLQKALEVADGGAAAQAEASRLLGGKAGTHLAARVDRQLPPLL